MLFTGYLRYDHTAEYSVICHDICAWYDGNTMDILTAGLYSVLFPALSQCPNCIMHSLFLWNLGSPSNLLLLVENSHHPYTVCPLVHNCTVNEQQKLTHNKCTIITIMWCQCDLITVRNLCPKAPYTKLQKNKYWKVQIRLYAQQMVDTIKMSVWISTDDVCYTSSNG